jgi:uncharacterized protein (DUF1800 family)
VAIDKHFAAAIAVTRFGLGAKPGEIDRARADPQGFLAGQIRRDGAEIATIDGAGSPARMGEVLAYQQERKAARQAGDPKSDPVMMAAKLIRQDTGADFLARVRLGAATDAGFRERWALFWANHFTVSANKLATATLVGPFEAEAIRPRVFGRFEDLLVASSSHPAMLIYLDQAQSIGPDSMAAGFAAQGGKRVGLNENLAREIMELHTVGVDAGYTQSDVTEFAKAMTGWSVAGAREPEAFRGRFLFRERAHEPGRRTIMGRRYGENGVGQALAVMKDLAASPHTARHIALKLGRHFVADEPAPTLTARLERVWLDTGGDLGRVAAALVSAPEAWDVEARKFKTPYEFMVSSWRLAGVGPEKIEDVAPTMTAMGQKPFSAPSPKGWSEAAQDWCAPDAVVKRMAWSEGLAGKVVGDQDPGKLASEALGPRLTPAVAKAVARAETRAEGLSILLMSPEFQRR